MENTPTDDTHASTHKVHRSALNMLSHLLDREGMRYTILAPVDDEVHLVCVRHPADTAWHDAPDGRRAGQFRIIFKTSGEMAFEWRAAGDDVGAAGGML